MKLRNLGAAALAGAALLGTGAHAQTAPAQATPAAQAPALTKPTEADFGALPILSRPRISPDGKSVAAEGLIGGEQVVVIVDISTPERKLRKLGLPPKHQLEWLRWAGNNRILVSLSRIERVMAEEMRITRLTVLDLTTGKQRIVGPREQGIDGDDLVHIDRDGNYVLLSTQASIYQYPSVYRVDLDSGQSSRIVAPQDGVWNWFSDADGVVRAGLGVDGTKSWLVYRSAEGGTFKRVMRHDDAKGRGEGIMDLQPIRGSDLGYVIADGKGGRFALYRYDFKADELGEMVYENPTVDIDTFALDRADQLIGIYYTDDKAEMVWFDPELKKLQARVDRALPGFLNRVVSMSEDKMRLLVQTRSDDHPGAYYLYDRAVNRMDPIVMPYDSMRGKQLSRMQPVRYKARDGLEIRAYLTLPAGKESAKDLPLVVMPHGGPFARDEWGYEPWVQYLASRGYAVLQPNYRGSTGFGRAFVEKGTGQFGRGMQDDVDDGVKWLAAQGTVDAKRVCIMGASYGGYAAMLAAVRNPEMYRCAISFAGLSDVASQLRFSRSSFSAPRYFSNWRDRVKGDKDFDLADISPLKSAERMTVPILLAHGDEDDVVPLYQSRRLHEALIKVKRDHEYVVYEGEGHGFKKAENATDFLKRVGAFLDKHNPADAAK